MKGKKNSGGVRWNTLGVFLSRSNWFYLVLLAFPAWNVLFYLTVIPDDGSAREVGVDPQLALAQSSSSYSSLGMNSEGGQRYSQTWRTLDEVVRGRREAVRHLQVLLREQVAKLAHTTLRPSLYRVEQFHGT